MAGYSSNPKAYYNQAEYTSPSAQYPSPAQPVVHKPDDTSAEGLPPPPPYSASSANTPSSAQENRSSADYAKYGSIPAQAGLLDPVRNDPVGGHYGPTRSTGEPRGGDSASASASSVPPWQRTNPHLPRDWYNDNNRRSTPPPSSSPSAPAPPLPSAPSQHIEPQRSPVPRGRDRPQRSWSLRGWDGPGPHPNNGRDNRDSGCCRKWCKYLFLAILIWLVLLKYSDIIQFSPPSSHMPQGDMKCDDRPAKLWEALPSNIRIEKNVRAVLEGHVSGGRVVIHPARPEDGGQGSIQSRVRVASKDPSITDRMHYAVDRSAGSLTLMMPQSGECIYVEMDIYVPGSAQSVFVRMANVHIKVDGQMTVDSVSLETSNAGLRFVQSGWRGRELVLTSQNGEIRVEDTIEASQRVEIQTSNAALVVRDVLSRQGQVRLENANGQIDARSITDAKTAEIVTSNGPVHVDTLRADRIAVESANGWIEINRAQGNNLGLKTSNAPVNAVVVDHDHVQADISTSNAPINLHMPSKFSGEFFMQTSHNKVILKDSLGEAGRIQYQINRDQLKQGIRLDGATAEIGKVSAISTNANVMIAFDS
ncbi:hypothetical protein DFQ28_008747 [Apophysomyces sp. BC1034]|nr:hypothetical protein DFQ30_002855 [Apophysomyces sp. BC1015]KAG0174445.1 hypothetical protein DFQ29_007489 [Apophysomyces sp. BC1021]KAG0185801.1 hypothetical protein DFQ28_008747 [Apophysomyces sp. BC1034]